MAIRPENGVYIILGEVNLLVTAMRRNSRWTSHSHQDEEQDPLLSSFSQLKNLLNTVSDLTEFAPNEFLAPFLDVIRSEDTTGPITGLALSSVNKFLSYGLIEPGCETAAAAIENIADAITHARFVGTDPGSDEVVLMKILYVLRTLLLTPAGAKLTNESVCEIMQSCFRICFEMRLSELLRKSAEHTLMDMVQLLFSRLPQFKEDPKWAAGIRKLKMRAGGMDSTRTGKKKKSPKSRHKRQTVGVNSSQAHMQPVQNGHNAYSVNTQPNQEATEQVESQLAPPHSEVAESIPTPPPSEVASPAEDQYEVADVIATTPVAHGLTVVDIQQQFQDADRIEQISEEQIVIDMAPPDPQSEYNSDVKLEERPSEEDVTSYASMDIQDSVMLKVSGSEADLSVTASDREDGEMATLSENERSMDGSAPEAEYVNPRGVRFTPHQHGKDGTGPLIPYGLPCVRELFRFLISLTSPLDRHNTDVMIHMGLSLLTVALESGADHIPNFPSLISLVKDDMCRNLFFLLQSERLSLFAASIRVCFLLFEALRSHLKFQLEMYLTKLMDIIVSESPRISYEQHEIALESLVQLLRIPGLVTELYLNYDCDLYCTNLFEDLMKLLSKNAFPVSGLFSTHLLSLDALLAVIESIEQHCHHRVLHSSKSGSMRDLHCQENAPHRVAIEERHSASVEDLTLIVPPAPPTSGYAMAQIQNSASQVESSQEKKDSRKRPQIRPNRMKAATSIPSEEELVAIKNKKKLYQSGTEQFNIKPAKGIAFLQEHGLLSTPLDAGELVTFLKENPKLDKKMIGEYISLKKNPTILEAYQKSFNFEDTRIDEALRMFLETFRLPGEAPVISYIMEHFADHWHKMNGEPFANSDAAFTLAYAVIMLNVDQHNLNAKKQNIPMNVEDFRKNVKGVNGGKNFDEEMLNEIFESIRNEEIVMPAEQTGLVKDNYLWKILLRRGATKEGDFLHIPTGHYDRDLFAIVWGPTVAALSFVFDKSMDESIIHKAISGFRKCAMISAHYGLSDVFDNLVISLCKFTTLLSAPESPESISVFFGQNMKAQLAAKTVFGLAHRHGDILREGWKNILDCMLQLFRAKLLPEILVKVEDFVNPTGRISLVQEEPVVTQRMDTGVLSSFYSYFALTETTQQRGPSLEEQEATRQARCCLEECHVENLITESKFLRADSLQELIKALIFASRFPDDSMIGSPCEEEAAGMAAVFYLELLIKVILQNRDRISPFWQSIRDHLYSLIVNANENTFLVERAVVGLLRLAIRLLRREEIAAQVLNSLGMLLMMKPQVIHSVARQVSYGLHDLLKTNAANIHSYQDWYTLFTLLEVVGAGADPPPFMQVTMGVNVQEVMTDAGAQSDSELTSDKVDSASESGVERDYTSDSELYVRDSPSKQRTPAHPDTSEMRMQHNNGSWYMVNKEEVESTKPTTPGSSTSSMLGSRGVPVNQYNIALTQELKYHDPRSLLKSCETLAFLVRDAAHITPHNFESCVHTIRTFVEASLNGGHHHQRQSRQNSVRENKRSKKRKDEAKMKKSRSSPSHLSNMHDSDEEKEITDGYHSLSLQLLDLMHTLHTRAAKIFSAWAEEQPEEETDGQMEGQLPREPYMVGFESLEAVTGALWAKCWCPLLQGIARLCCDSRRQVRSSALTYLQRALLVHDLQTLSAAEWEDCFNKVLFPLLSKLLDSINSQDPSGIEETRMRAATLLCKVFLQHLSPLLSLSTFTALWLTILEFMDKYMHADRSDLLSEAIPELLKNMLLVMYTAGILSSSHEDTQLWKLTWDRIHTFLPNLRDDVFKPHEIGPYWAVSPRKPTEGSTEKCSSSSAGDNSNQPTTTQPQPRANSPLAPSPPPPCASPPPPGNQESRFSPCSSPQRPASPLAATEGLPPSANTYILHPPLPAVSSSSSATSVVPLLLNPDIMQAANYPIITPQSTPEKRAEVPPQGNS